MKKALFATGFIILTAISCSKDDPAPAPGATVYMSLTAGSTRNYDVTSITPPGAPTNYTVTSTNRDTTIGSRSYHVFTNSSSGASEYYNISGNDYYTFQKLPAALGGSSIENLYLKDNAAVNATWTQTNTVTLTGVPFPVTVNIINKIVEKGLSKTVNSIAYTDVIHVKTDITASVIGTPVTGLTTDIHYYYAPRVGLIQNNSQIDLDFMGIVNHTNTQTILKTATIL